MTSNLEKSDGLVRCSVKNAAVLCENHCKESRKFELARLKKKEKEKEKKKKKTKAKKKKKKKKKMMKILAVWLLFIATGYVVRHDNTQR